MTDQKPRMSMDELVSIAEEVARTGEGAEKFRAIKMLTSMNTTQAAIAEPLTTDEMMERVSRIMKGVGILNTQLCYRMAFPSTRYDIDHVLNTQSRTDFLDEELPRELKEKASKIFSLRKLYREFPQTKQPGIPKGFPVHQSIAAQKEWVRRQALRLYKEQWEQDGDQQQGKTIQSGETEVPVGRTSGDGPAAPSVPD